MRPSLPRADWPCATTLQGADGQGATRFIYDGAPSTCQVPVTDWIRVFGGCPTRTEVEGIEILAPEYDAEGRMTTPRSPYTYRWGTKGPIAHITGDAESAYRRVDGGLALGTTASGGPGERYVFDASGRIVKFEQYGPTDVLWSLEFSYEGARVVAFTHQSSSGAQRYEVHYDCSKLPSQPAR